MVLRDVLRSLPAEKFLFDGFPIGMDADGAFSFVPAEGGRRVGLWTAALPVVSPRGESGKGVVSHV